MKEQVKVIGCNPIRNCKQQLCLRRSPVGLGLQLQPFGRRRLQSVSIVCRSSSVSLLIIELFAIYEVELVPEIVLVINHYGLVISKK